MPAVTRSLEVPASRLPAAVAAQAAKVSSQEPMEVTEAPAGTQSQPAAGRRLVAQAAPAVRRGQAE